MDKFNSSSSSSQSRVGIRITGSSNSISSSGRKGMMILSASQQQQRRQPVQSNSIVKKSRGIQCELARVLCSLVCLLTLERDLKAINDKPLASFQLVQANQDSNRLYEDLMMSYNRFVRPVQNDSDTLVVKLGLKLSQLIDVVSINSCCR